MLHQTGSYIATNQPWLVAVLELFDMERDQPPVVVGFHSESGPTECSWLSAHRDERLACIQCQCCVVLQYGPSKGLLTLVLSGPGLAAGPTVA